MMKIVSNILLSLVALVAVGCGAEVESPEQEATNRAPERVFAKFDELDTRLYADGMTLRWSAGDCLTLFAKGDVNHNYQFEGATGDVEGSFVKLSEDAKQNFTLQHNVAVYPYNATTTIDRQGAVWVNLPKVQTYAENSFGSGSNTMVARSQSEALHFKNCCGYLKLQLYGEAQVKRIELTDNSGSAIAGSTKVTIANDGTPQLTLGTGSATITLDCGEGVELSKDKSKPTAFWFVLPEVTLTKGFTVKIYDAEGNVTTKSTDKVLTIDRNMLHPMSAFELKEEAPASAFEAMAGVWHLTEWAGATPSFDVYLDIEESGRVLLYQRIDTLAWQMFESEATLTDGVISGVYADGVAWGASYRYTLNNTTMTWTNTSDASDKSVYSRSELPESVATTRGDVIYSAQRFL